MVTEALECCPCQCCFFAASAYIIYLVKYTVITHLCWWSSHRS
ncbi:hypothetical protein BVRB_6g130570 [Beta vulgaris subsp. vulgaris]|nr:hypothetical protein BVRB_6g130570 [Beta vulgaris subsp. vulgaris]